MNASSASSEQARTCPSCGGSGEEWYQTGGGEFVQAACSTCGDGRVGSKGAGTVPG